MHISISRTSDDVCEYPLHSHSCWEIMVYIQGQGLLRTEKESIPFFPGTAIVMPPGHSHGSISPRSFQNISIRGNFSHLLLPDIPFSALDNDEGDAGTLANILYRNRYADSSYLHSLCDSLIRLLLQQRQLKSAVDQTVDRIRHTIVGQAFDSNLDPTQLLRDSGYAEDYIRMCFRKNVGMPPGRFLHQVRIDHACSLLGIYRSSIPLSQVAEMCGFTDYPYFSRIFKQLTGYSPREYILENRKQGTSALPYFEKV